MIRKLISTAVLAAAAAAPAYALENAGFEAGTTGWSPLLGGTVEQRGTGPVTIFDDTYGDFDTPYDVAPAFGSSYGLLIPTYPTTPGSSTMHAFNMSGSPTAAGDIMFVRMFSAEWNLPTNNDYFTVTFNNNADPTATFTWRATDTNQYTYGGVPGIAMDSGWLRLDSAFMPTGTNSVYIEVHDVSTDGGNKPLVAVDFMPAAAVPEADVSAMLIAGLGALGFAARRRKQQAA